ncbi:hypothetical protein C497_05677 [Halalkalicoccus jeotgali B3]|uniref:Uncharacterized protein n=2 Tax=Halalkalicoccus jeotgali TaxID=413810 RepID=D8JAW6_HALJB|nr:hypothetical protein HacjB3_07265 [Halalkalicoccus jeotgali B3]ELY39421.1 hypothetical protein C497_05677 [Halalkalicoccus jeotgali B3]
METIADEVENNRIFGKTGSQHGVAMSSSEEEYTIGDDYIFARYVHEVPQERTEISDGEVVLAEGNVARIMHFLLTRDGDYAYESVDRVYDDHALEYFIGDDSFEIDFECNRYNRFTRDQMREFYSNAFRVRGMKLKEIGERDRNGTSVSDEVADYIENAGENTVRSEFSTGQKDKNLKGPDIIDGFGQLSEIDYIRIKDSEGEINEAYNDGRYTMSYSTDTNLSDLGGKVRDTISTVTTGLTRVDD